MEDVQVQDNLSAPVAAEKMLPQSDVDKLVIREKYKAAQEAKREAEAEYQRQLEAIQQQGMQQQQRNADVPRQVDADALYQQVQERFNKEMQERQLQQEMSTIANNYLAKMKLGRDAYTDFDDITKDFDPTAFPQLTYLVSGIENAGDIVYELAKNPSKLVTLDTLAQRAPKQAQAELLKLSRSISENQIAQKEAGSNLVSAPLDQLQPTRIAGSNGKKTIRDLRSEDFLRG